MNPALITAILTQIIIPEIAALIRMKPSATDAEIIAALQVDADKVIALGEAWLAAHPEGTK